MKRLPIVALIGQTNAGKSSILNRMAHKNIAIVAREEGTTRDNVVATIDDQFILVDTAGLKDPSDDFEASIQEQIQDAIESADVILVTLDSSKYFNHRDAKIAKDALRSKKPVFLLLNKCDLAESLPIEEFRALGIAPERIYYISATTGQGIASFKEGLSGSLREFRSAAARGLAPSARGDGPDGRDPGTGVWSSHERGLVKKILEYSSVLQESVSEMAPHKLANYLYELAQDFSRFYESCPVIGCDHEQERLKLVQVYLDTLTHGLNILGINIPEEM